MKSIGEFSNASADKIGVNRFAEAMHDKMTAKRNEGRGGWHRYRHVYAREDMPETYGCEPSSLRRMLRNHIKKGLTGSNLVDIANFCMMLWNREQSEKRK